MSKMIDNMRLSDGLEAFASSASRSNLNSHKKHERPTTQFATPFAEYMNKKNAHKHLPQFKSLPQAQVSANFAQNAPRGQDIPVKPERIVKYERANYKQIEANATRNQKETNSKHDVKDNLEETQTHVETLNAFENVKQSPDNSNQELSNTIHEPHFAPETQANIEINIDSTPPIEAKTEILAEQKPIEPHIMPVPHISVTPEFNALAQDKLSIVQAQSEILTIQSPQNSAPQTAFDAANINSQGAIANAFQQEFPQSQAVNILDVQNINGEILNSKPERTLNTETIQNNSLEPKLNIEKLMEFVQIQQEIEKLSTEAEGAPAQEVPANLELKAEHHIAEIGVAKESISKLDAPLLSNAVNAVEQSQLGKEHQNSGQNDNMQSLDVQKANAQYETGMKTSTLDALPFHVKRMVDEAKEILEIRLDPLELGKIEIRLERGADDKMTAHIVADLPQTRDLLVKDSAQLEKTLRESGMNLSGEGMQFSLRQDQQNNAHEQKPSPKLTASAVPPTLDSSLTSAEQHINTHTLAYNRLYRPARMDLRI